MKKFLFIGISILTLSTLVACGKKTEPEVVPDDSNYAINETRDPVEEPDDDIPDIITEVPVEITEDESNKIPESMIAHDQIYNISADKNALNIKDMNTISIDGKLVSFPCDYNYIIDKFGELYNVTTNGFTGTITMDPVDTSVTGTIFEVDAKPETGTGTITFKFISDDGSNKSITNMTCTGVTLQGGNIDGTKVMTLALPNNVTFGSGYKDITAFLDDPSKGQTDKDSYRLLYNLYDENRMFVFVGYNNGLNFIQLDYKAFE